MSGQISGMTGFGRADGAADGWTWSVEARSVNGRNLEVRYRGPNGFDELERLAFANTYEEHLRNVARWRQIERQKAGLPPEAPAPAAPGMSTAPMTDPAGQPAAAAPPGQATLTLPAGASQGPNR